MNTAKINGEGIELLCNPMEQMIVEKTSSFIKFGELSTRTKDLFDIYFLITKKRLNFSKLKTFIDEYFVQSNKVESLESYKKMMWETIDSDYLQSNLMSSNNWLDVSVSDILKKLKMFFRTL